MALGYLDDIKITEIADAIRAVEKSTDPIPFKEFENRIIDSQLSTAEARGTSISLEDVSPVAHPIEVAASNKNLIPYPYDNWSGTLNGVTFTDNGNGSITLQGTAEKTFGYQLVNSVLDIPTGVPVVVSGGILTENEKKVVVNVRKLKPDGTNSSFIEHSPTSSNPRTGQLSDGEKINYVGLYIYEGAILDHTIYPQLEYGSVATDYFPYVPVINKNLIPYPYRNATQTKNGVTFTDNGDGSITINGTPTAQTTHALYIGTDAFKFSKYTSCKSGGSVAQDGLCMSLALVGVSDSTIGLAYETGTNPILYIIVAQGVTYNNITVYPKIEEGSVSTNFRISQKTRNLIPFPYADKSITQNGGTFTINDDGSVTCSGTPTGYGSIRLNNRIFLKQNSKYVLSAQGEHTNVKVGCAVYNEAGELIESYSASSTSKTRTIDTSKYTTKVYLDISVARLADNQEMTGTVYPQLEYGQVMTKFMPYGTFGVKSCGKNLVDGSYHEQEVSGGGITIQYLPEEDAYLLNGTATRSGNLLRPEVYIPVNGKIAITVIHLSGTAEKGTGECRPVFYTGGVDTYRAPDANWASITLPDSGTATAVATTSKNYMSCFWFYLSSGNVLNNYKCRIMVEKGDKATEYEPYKEGQEVPIKLHETAKLGSISSDMTIYSTDGGVLFNASYLKGYANIDLDKFASEAKLQEKTVVPSKSEQVVTANAAFDGLSKVTVEAIPDEYLIPEGSIDITTTNTIDVSRYANAIVTDSDLNSANIKSGVNILGITGTYTGDSVELQSKIVSPSAEKQVITADSNYDGLSQVTVNACSGTTTITDTNKYNVVGKQYAQVSDSDLKGSNILSSANILGIQGTVEEKQWRSNDISIYTHNDLSTNTTNRTYVTIPVQLNESKLQLPIAIKSASSSNPPTMDVLIDRPSIRVTSTGLVAAEGNGFETHHYLSSDDDYNFVSENIKAGVSIFGVDGNYSGDTQVTTADITFDIGRLNSGNISAIEIVTKFDDGSIGAEELTYESFNGYSDITRPVVHGTTIVITHNSELDIEAYDHTMLSKNVYLGRSDYNGPILRSYIQVGSTTEPNTIYISDESYPKFKNVVVNLYEGGDSIVGTLGATVLSDTGKIEYRETEINTNNQGDLGIKVLGGTSINLWIRNSSGQANPAISLNSLISEGISGGTLNVSGHGYYVGGFHPVFEGYNDVLTIYVTPSDEDHLDTLKIDLRTLPG